MRRRSLTILERCSYLSVLKTDCSCSLCVVVYVMMHTVCMYRLFLIPLYSCCHLCV